MTTRTERRGNLEYRYADYGHGREFNVRLLRCPACGEQFSWNSRVRYLHIADHAPEDFGLTPLTHD